MSFKIKILVDEIHCMDKEFNVYEIRKVKVISQTPGVPDWYYGPKTSFFKHICARDTEHQATEVEGDSVVIF